MKAKVIILIALSILLTNLTTLGVEAKNYMVDSTSAKIEKFDPVKATQDYINQLSPEKKEQSDSYFEGGYWFKLWNFLLSVFIAWVFLSLGLSSWIKKIAFKVKNVNLQNLIYISFYLLFAYLISFPLNFYEGFVREHQYHLSNLSFGGWLGEDLKGLLLSIIFGSPLFMLLYVAIRKVKKSWWVWGTGISVLFLIFGMFIAPILIFPIFNKYKPLDDGDIKNEILSIARANGIPANNVYQFDASKQSTRISANVSGIGSTIRISLNDNLLNKCNLSEIKAVMAHEIGHYVLNHIYKLMLIIGLLLFLGFYIINWSFNKILNRWGEKLRIVDISDIGGLPLIILLFSTYFFIASPILNNISRVTEIEADYFGLNAAREPDGFASVAMKLSDYRKISPGQWEEIIFYDHPSGKTRINNAMIWKAENIKQSVSAEK